MLVNESLKPEATRYNNLAVLEISYSSVTLLKEVWPIMYNMFSAGSFRAGMQEPLLPLNNDQARQIQAKKEIDDQHVNV